MSGYLLEIACFNEESAMDAQGAGADRIELCRDYDAGGLTPDPGTIEHVRQALHIPLHVIIRPHADGFVYNDKDMALMKAAIRFCKHHMVNGVVFGVLTESGQVDVSKNKELVALANPMSCTFHRAIDACPDLRISLEQVISCGFDTVLTSGGSPHAIQGIETLQHMVEWARERITIMPGGGVRSLNIRELMKVTNAKAYHSAAWDAANGKVNIQEVKALKACVAP